MLVYESESIVIRRQSGWETKQKPIQHVLCSANELERYSRPDLRVHNLFPKWPEFRMNLARKSRKCSGLQFFSLPTENCREADKPARKPISILVSSFLILSGDCTLCAEPAEGTDVVGVTD